jgi:hypothetical protein
MTEHLQPRLLKREDAARYCSLSTEQFSSWVKEGRLPGAIHGTHRWDRRALDLKLDELSGLPVQSELSPLEQYKAELNARHDRS